jgi:hypothetical protein
MSDTKFTSEQLAKLKEAKASGALRVKYGNKEVEYRSMAEIDSAIQDIERELNKDAYRRRRTIKFSKGV